MAANYPDSVSGHKPVTSGRAIRQEFCMSMGCRVVNPPGKGP